MRLLTRSPDGEIQLVSVNDEDAPPYAILSHTWTDGQEVTYNELVDGTGKDKAGYDKVLFCVNKATEDRLDHCWVDTCCINKSTSDEVSMSINSMFRYYQRANKCYVYLADVQVADEVIDAQAFRITWAEAFRRSRWFTRGWTLQELLAPANVEFFSKECKCLGSKISLEQEIHKITRIPIEALRGRDLLRFDVEERMGWAAKRTTTLNEDRIYCLLGIFGVFLPLIYGEGAAHAELRLREEIRKRQEGREPEALLDTAARQRASSAAHVHQGSPQFGNTHVSGGLALQGNFNGLTINSAVRPDFAGQFSHSLLKPVTAYVPRALLCDQIRAQLRNNVDNNTSILVVWGLGGAGKTQLVLDYVRQHHTEYKATFWLEAGRKESLERDIVNLYMTLYGVQPVPGGGTISTEDAVTAVKGWFAGREGPWLIVFDGADEIDERGCKDYVDIKHYIPNAVSLQVIITSRSSTAKHISRLGGVQVGDMEEEEAVELFYRYSYLQRDDDGIREELEAIAHELGYLALAVTLASTYVGRTPRLQANINAYLPEYRQRRRALLTRKPESLVHQYSESVLTTWETSFQAIQEQSNSASTLLTMLSFVNFDDIFVDLFATRDQTKSGNKEEGQDDTAGTARFRFEVYELEECFEILEKYSMVQWKHDQGSYAMHKLVHAWGFDRLDQDEQDAFSHVVFMHVLHAVSICSNIPSDKLRLVPHAMVNFAALVEVGANRSQERGDVLDGLAIVGDFIARIGRLQEGSRIKEHVLKKRRELGDEHPDTISAMNNFSNTLAALGQLAEAVTMKTNVLEMRKRILGDKHPDTIMAMNNFADTLGDLGQLDEAVTMQKEILEMSKRILGDEHPYTIVAMNNLANRLGDLGQLDEAVTMQKEVLKMRKWILGDEHPDTISAMNNLGVTLCQLGQLDEAVTMQKEIMKMRKRILGDEHPETITAMSNLADMLGDLGQLDNSITTGKEAYTKIIALFGPHHPYSKKIRQKLIRRCLTKFIEMFRKTSPADENSLVQRTIRDFKYTFGSDHQSTFLLLKLITDLYISQEDLESAARMYEQTIQRVGDASVMDDESLGDTITQLGRLYIQNGRFADAENFFTQELDRFGEDINKDCARAMSALCGLYGVYFCYHMAVRQEQSAQRYANIMGVTNEGSARDMTNSLVKLCEKFGTIKPSFFSLLGRMLIWTGRDDDAVTAFQHQFRLAMSNTALGRTMCDNCTKQLRAGMQRFVCKVCADVDLCDECFADYEIDGCMSREEMKDCQAHSFLNVRGEEAVCAGLGSAQPIPLQWLRSITAAEE